MIEIVSIVNIFQFVFIYRYFYSFWLNVFAESAKMNQLKFRLHFFLRLHCFNTLFFLNCYHCCFSHFSCFFAFSFSPSKWNTNILWRFRFSEFHPPFYVGQWALLLFVLPVKWPSSGSMIFVCQIAGKIFSENVKLQWQVMMGAVLMMQAGSNGNWLNLHQINVN